MELRELTNGDAGAWWKLRLEALETEPFAFGKSVEEHRATSAVLPLHDAAEGSFILGAFEGDALVGIATFAREAGLKERHKAHLYGMFVTPECRGKGVGRALIVTVLERAKQDASLEQILLTVGTQQQAARKLYRRLGFQTYAIEPNALKIGSTYIDEELMLYRIGS